MTTLPDDIVELIISFVRNDEFVLLKSNRTVWVYIDKVGWFPKQKLKYYKKCLIHDLKMKRGKWQTSLGCYSAR